MSNGRKIKIEAAVKKETFYIALGMVIMSAIMEAVFLVIGKWSVGVLYSNLLVGGFMVLNFFIMAMTVQKAVSYEDEKKSKNLMKISQTLRFLALAGILALGALLSNIGDRTGPFEFWALIPPLFFNRITMMIRGFAIKKEPVSVGGEPKTPDDVEEDES